MVKIEDLDLSVRAYNCLKRVGIDTVELKEAYARCGVNLDDD